MEYRAAAAAVDARIPQFHLNDRCDGSGALFPRVLRVLARRGRILERDDCWLTRLGLERQLRKTSSSRHRIVCNTAHYRQSGCATAYLQQPQLKTS